MQLLGSCKIHRVLREYYVYYSCLMPFEYNTMGGYMRSEELRTIATEIKQARLLLSEKDWAHAVNVNETIKESRIATKTLLSQ
ncbi:hypothetical protein K0M31_012397 [Melipona bicolor]|uniref:Uncharacterized protein n=1 Tax=Melipona bicolor TaxID=60889 RepID=A0AA40FJT3_9HYME|nr:hypothetical protein K0M31_012397 [Melipona bicolor]